MSLQRSPQCACTLSCSSSHAHPPSSSPAAWLQTTIRTLGGLLSASALCSSHPSISAHCSSGDAELFLSKAQDLAERLAPAFEATSTGIPLREVNFKTGESFEDADNRGLASLAEVTSVQLE